MTKLAKISLCLVLSLMFGFITIGYSALTDNLSVGGTAGVRIPEGLFITDVEFVSSSNLDSQSVSFVEYSTTVKASMNRKASNNWWQGQNSSGSVTYKVTVFNNTDLEYAYRGIYYQSSLDGYNGNEYVSTRNGNNSIGVVTTLDNAAASKRIVAPGGRMTFEVTYTVGKSMTDRDYHTLINYQFGINVETEEEAREAVYTKFLDILNTSSTYETLVDKLDDKFDGNQEWTSNYIGNVGDASTDDAVAVNTLFAGQLQMIINGVTTPARVIIKHENLDNDRMTGDDYVATNSNNGGVFRGYGCEMTMYFTVDALDTPNGSAPVYVSVFTCDRDQNGNIVGDWYRIGDTYHGYAPIVSYNGTAGGTGSFVTDNWTASNATYSPTDDYSYRVTSGTNIKTLVQAVDNDAIAEFQRLISRAKQMIDDTTYAGTGIALLEKTYEKASKFFTVDASGSPIANSDTTRAQICLIIAELDHAVDEAQAEIDKIEGNG